MDGNENVLIQDLILRYQKEMDPNGPNQISSGKFIKGSETLQSTQ